MELKNLISDDRAVSPVIGVILMVAITVILAAVIGTFVLGLGDSIGENAPSASYDWDQDGQDSDTTSIELEHRSGDSIDGDRVSASVAGATYNNFGTEEWADDISAGDTAEFVETGVDAGDVNVGEETNAYIDGFQNEDDEQIEVSDDDTIRVIWTASGGGSSSTLTSWDVQ